MVRKILSTLTISVIALNLNLSFFNFAYAETRPSDCITLFQYMTQTTTGYPSTASTPFKKCATLSSIGYSLNLYYGNETEEQGDKDFIFVGNTDFGVLGSGDIGEWVYKNNNQKYYVSIADDSNDWIKETHHYRTGTNTEWDQFATTDFHSFNVVSTNKALPEYMNDDGVNADGERFIWRIVINGNIKLFDKRLSESSAKKANVMLIYDENKGPSLDIVPSDADGSFEFSRNYASGQGVGNEEIWVNAGTYNKKDPSDPASDAIAKSAGTVTKLVLYIQVETEAGDKFEKFVPIDLATDLRFHKDHQNTLVDNNISEVNIEAGNKVTEFSRAAQGEQSWTRELLGTDACGNRVDTVPGAIISAFCVLGIMLNNFAVDLIGKAFQSLGNSLGV